MICNNCNFEIDKNEKFCKNCGAQIKKENKASLIVRDVILYIISFIVLLVTIVMFINNKAIAPLIYAILFFILLCPITYKLIIKVFNDLNKAHIRIIGIVLTLVFSLVLIPTDESKTNIDDTEIKKSSNENKNITGTTNSTQLTEEKNGVQNEEQDRLKQEKEKKESEEKVKEDEKKRQEEEKVERIKNGETELNNGKFTLQAGHKGYYDSFAYYIEGSLVNNTNKKYSYVQIEFNVYDSNGIQLGSAIANINNLEAKGTWKFKAMEFGSDTENVASYKVVGVTAF